MDAPATLYRLLLERSLDSDINISHRRMPTFDEHCNFVISRPYARWYLIENEQKDRVGSIYLSKNNEIGIFIFRKLQGQGYGSAAVTKLTDELPKGTRVLANVNPHNFSSIKLFRLLGFKHIQNTYELET